MQRRSLPTLILQVLIIASLLAGCNLQAQPVQMQPNPHAELLASLGEMQRQYGFRAIEQTSLSICSGWAALPEDSAWEFAGDQNPLCNHLLHAQEGLLLSFSISEPASDSEQDFFFTFETAASDFQAFLSPAGLQTLVGGLPQSNSSIAESFDWQAEEVYALFVYRNDQDKLLGKIWSVESPALVAEVAADIPVETGALQAGVRLSGAQKLTLYNVWKMTSMQSEVAVDVNSSTTTPTSDPAAIAATAEVVESATPTPADRLLARLDLDVQETIPITSLTCDGKSVEEEEGFHWSEMTNANCDLSLQMGQALAFDFTLKNPVNNWANTVIWKLDANQDPSSEMPVKNLGINATNQDVVIKQDYQELNSFSFNEGFVLEPGKIYSALIEMKRDGGFEFQVWSMDEPDVRMYVVLNTESLPSTWIPNENEDWYFGVWLPEDQQLTISNLYHLILSPSDPVEDTDLPEGEVSEPEQPAIWTSPEDIPNLGDYYINGMTAYDGTVCEDVQATDAGVFGLPVLEEEHTYQCQTDLRAGSALAFEFVYTEATEPQTNTFSLALAAGQAEQQKIIRFTALDQVHIEKGDQFLDDIPLEGELQWQPGKRYTVVFALTDAIQILIWPSDDPQILLQSVIDLDLWNRYFDGMDQQETWQLRIWLKAGQSMEIQNMQRLMIQ